MGNKKGNRNTVRRESRRKWTASTGKVPVAMGSHLSLAFIPKFPSNAAAPSVWSLITTADTA